MNETLIASSASSLVALLTNPCSKTLLSSAIPDRSLSSLTAAYAPEASLMSSRYLDLSDPRDVARASSQDGSPLLSQKNLSAIAVAACTTSFTGDAIILSIAMWPGAYR